MHVRLRWISENQGLGLAGGGNFPLCIGSRLDIHAGTEPHDPIRDPGSLVFLSTSWGCPPLNAVYKWDV